MLMLSLPLEEIGVEESGHSMDMKSGILNP